MEVYGGNAFYCDIIPSEPYQCEVNKVQEECGYDIFSLGTMLKAGEENSDESLVPTISPLDKPIRSTTSDPQRYTGMTVEMKVVYTNMPDNYRTLTNWSYHYEISIIEGSKTEWIDVKTDLSGNKRDRYVYRGVNILAAVNGKEYQFDPATLLIQLTSTLALLSVANLFVETLMSKVLRLRGVYTSMKIKEMPDFSILNQQLNCMTPATASKLTYLDIKDMLEEIDSDFKRRRTSSVEEVRLAKAKAIQRLRSEHDSYMPPQINGAEDTHDNSNGRNKNSWIETKPSKNATTIDVKNGRQHSNTKKRNNQNSSGDGAGARISDVELTKKIIDNNS
jgi:hypothetical protein